MQSACHPCPRVHACCCAVTCHVRSLYHSLKDVYSPLLGTAQAGTGMDGRLAELLAQVQAGLGTAVRQGMPVRWGGGAAG